MTSQDTGPLLNKVTRASSDILIGQTRSVNSSHHGGYPLWIFSDQICVPYCFSLTQRIVVAQMDVSLQGSDENSTKGDYLLFYYLTEHCNILTEQIDQVCPFGYNGSYIS